MPRRARNQAASAPKHPKTLPANFPQHNLPAPYSELLLLGEGDHDATYDRIAAELKATGAETAAAKLLEMALDETYYDYWKEKVNENDPRAFTRLHAVCVLSRMGEAAHIAIESLLPLLGEEDDWLREEMPFFYMAMGAAAIEPLTAVLMDTEEETYTRVGASDSLAEIAEAHPETHKRVVSILEKALSDEKEDKAVVGFAIHNLMDLGAQESFPLIQQAYKEERVDEFLIQMADVEEHFGMPRVSRRKEYRELNPELFELSETLDALKGGDGEFEEDFAENSEEGEAQTPYVAPEKVGRNEPCPCGSGKKYKKCHGA